MSSRRRPEYSGPVGGSIVVGPDTPGSLRHRIIKNLRHVILKVTDEPDLFDRFAVAIEADAERGGLTADDVLT